jgi:hypothetical protein
MTFGFPSSGVSCFHFLAGFFPCFLIEVSEGMMTVIFLLFFSLITITSPRPPCCPNTLDGLYGVAHSLEHQGREYRDILCIVPALPFQWGQIGGKYSLVLHINDIISRFFVSFPFFLFRMFMLLSKPHCAVPTCICVITSKEHRVVGGRRKE